MPVEKCFFLLSKKSQQEILQNIAKKYCWYFWFVAEYPAFAGHKISNFCILFLIKSLFFVIIKTEIQKSYRL